MWVNFGAGSPKIEGTIVGRNRNSPMNVTYVFQDTSQLDKALDVLDLLMYITAPTVLTILCLLCWCSRSREPVEDEAEMEDQKQEVRVDSDPCNVAEEV